MTIRFFDYGRFYVWRLHGKFFRKNIWKLKHTSNVVNIKSILVLDNACNIGFVIGRFWRTETRQPPENQELHAATQEELRESTEFSSILDEENEKLQVQIQELTKKLAEVRCTFDFVDLKNSWNTAKI